MTITGGTEAKPMKRSLAPSLEARVDRKRTPFVRERFELRPASVERLKTTPWAFGFGAFSEIVYHDNNYCRRKPDGTLETWPETIRRVVEGVMSVRKDHHARYRLAWDEGRWQELAEEMALAFLRLECGPPGRGYAVMGTEFIYERGGFALVNCAATKIHPATIAEDFGWAMDALLCGSGVGFECVRRDYRLEAPAGIPASYVVPDTREGWVESLEHLVRSYRGGPPVAFDYGEIRAAGSPIKTFGGTCPGPEPLRRLHDGARERLDRYVRNEISSVRLVADIANQIGVCVVSGGVRRSAEILLGDPEDAEFLDLKDYAHFPEREAWGWVSNNSPRLTKREHFELIPTQIAPRARKTGEPGFVNLIAMQKFARFGRERPDPADLMNPCAEQPLCDKEVCNLSEVYPSRCADEKAVVRAAELACFYSSTVVLMPTHRPETNAVVCRNRRIGVGMSGIADWEATASAATVTRGLRRAYEAVVTENRRLASEAGIAASIRCTTVKPSGTVSLLAGVSPGGHFAMGERYIRRKRVSRFSPFRAVLDAAGYPWEVAHNEPETLVYEIPLEQPHVRTQAQAGMHEQALQLCMLQREWADGAVSFTIDFDPETEGPRLGDLLAQIAPMVKSVSVLPRSHGYKQAPYEEITDRELRLRRKMVTPLDWSRFEAQGTNEADKFCSGPVCEVRPKV